ncbi:MAG: Mur ligase family protein [Kofleriaceae bacterium]
MREKLRISPIWRSDVTPYADLLARLLPARRFGMVLGTERVRVVLDRLGSPDRRIGPVIQIGGTNGKGSVVAMLAALVRAGGTRVGAFTSPHLSSLRERFAIDGAPIDEDALVAAADRVVAAGGGDLTFFEQLTAMAAVAFADAQVDVALFEVGLGGRFDATTAIAARIAVVTGVAMDHEAILGSTLEAIAREKAGIFKRDQRVVIGASGEPAAVPLLEAAARAAKASHITVIGDAAVIAVPPLALRGAHQRRNAAAALAALDELAAFTDIRIDANARRAALAQVVHPGRFERIGDIILDGAHNPHGAAALADTLREHGLHPALIVGVSNDKDAVAIARELAPVASHVIATRYQQDRALAPAALAAAFHTAGHAFVEQAPDLGAALGRARELGTTTVIAGSLFLVGEARVLLLGAPADPIVVGDPAHVRS